MIKSDTCVLVDQSTHLAKQRDGQKGTLGLTEVVLVTDSEALFNLDWNVDGDPVLALLVVGVGGVLWNLELC